MTNGQNKTFDETPYRAFLYEFFGDFFRGCHDDAWRARWQDAVTVTNAKCNLRFCLMRQHSRRPLPAPSTVLVPKPSRKHKAVGTAPRHYIAGRLAELRMSSMLVMAWLTIDHIGITLPFAALLLRQGELDDLRQLVDSIALWWPRPEAQLR